MTIFARFKTISVSFLMILTISIIAGCGSGNQASTDTGSIAAKIIWNSTNKNAGKSVALAQPGVETVRLTVSGPGMNNISRDFPAAAGQGVVDGVPVGTGRVLSITGIDISGRMIYSAQVDNITVEKDITNSVGPVTMSPAYLAIAGAYTGNWRLSSNQLSGTFNVTIDSIGNVVGSTSNGDKITGTIAGTSSAADYTYSGLAGSTVWSGTFILSTKVFAGTLGSGSSAGIFSTNNIPMPTSPSAYFPSGTGNTWNYKITSSYSGAIPMDLSWTVVESGSTGFLSHSRMTFPGSTNQNDNYENVTISNGNYYSTGGYSLNIFTDTTGLQYSSRTDFTYNAPGLLWMPTEFTVGKSSTVSTVETSISSTFTSTQNITVSYLVEAFENVTVPAGTFNAARVSYTNTWADITGNATTNTTTYWFAPGIGLVKSISTDTSGTSTQELLSYSISPGTVLAKTVRK